MITPAFALTATERVLPKLALDFTTASLDSRVTFMRTTGASNPATYVNSSGYVTAATDNQPRFDFDPITLACKGLLIEETRTSYVTYSEDFRNTADAGEPRPWVYTNVSVAANNQNGPDGTLSADTLGENSTSGSHNIYTVSATPSSGYVVYSIFAKQGSGTRYLQLRCTGLGNDKAFANFDLTNGIVVVGGTGGTELVSTSMEEYASGFYRCVMVANHASAPSGMNVALSNTTTELPSYQGNGTSGIHIWGAQLEAGAFATSYIPTTSAALTRNADVATMTGTNFSDWFNASEGTFESTFITARQVAISSTGVFWVNNASGGAVTLFFRGTGALGAQVLDDAGATQADMSPSGIISADSWTTATLAYKQNSFASCANAGTVITDSVGAVPSPDNMVIGKRGVYLNGHIANINYWPMRLADNEVKAFSK